MKFFPRAMLGAAVLWSTFGAQAALVSFDLNRSNVLADGQSWLRVTIDDQGLPGSINFHVWALRPLLALAGGDFGIDEFGFNSPFALSRSNITGLPANWDWDGRGRMGPFGLFDARLGAQRGNAGVRELSFSIVGIDGDAVSSYLRASSRRADEGNVFFAAHAKGFVVSDRNQEDDKGEHKHWGKGENEGDGDGSAWFGGSKRTWQGSSEPPPNAVPLPPAFGLLIAGLAALLMTALLRTGAARRGVPVRA